MMTCCREMETGEEEEEEGEVWSRCRGNSDSMWSFLVPSRNSPTCWQRDAPGSDENQRDCREAAACFQTGQKEL